MKKKKKKRIGVVEIVKASRKGSREAEIENHGRPISYHHVFKSKKVYNRKKNKADLPQDDLPYSLPPSFPKERTSCMRRKTRLFTAYLRI